MLDLSQDYLIIDDPSDCILEVKQSEGTWAAPVTIPYAQWFFLSEQDASADPLFQSPFRNCHIWLQPLSQAFAAQVPPQVPPPIPKRGDKISTRAGDRYLVQEVLSMDRDQANTAQRFKLTAKRTPL